MKEIRCPECYGRGYFTVTHARRVGVGIFEYRVERFPCPECRGTGEVALTADRWVDPGTLRIGCYHWGGK